MRVCGQRAVRRPLHPVVVVGGVGVYEYIYILYIYVSVCVCVCVIDMCGWLGALGGWV
jgi:hypothetical protein